MPNEAIMEPITSSASEEEWAAAMANEEPETSVDEVPDLSEESSSAESVAEESASDIPNGFTTDDWAALPAATQQKIASQLEAVEMREREKYDRLAARHEDVQTSYTLTMKSFKELADNFKKPETKDEKPVPPTMPDPEEVDWTDGRAVAKYTQAVAKAAAAETEARIRAEMEGTTRKVKEETSAEFALREQQANAARTMSTIQQFEAAHPDLPKFKKAMSSIILNSEMEERIAAECGKPLPFKSDSQKLEEAYKEAKEQEEFRQYKAQKQKTKTSPSPSGLGAGRGSTQPVGKPRETIGDSFDEAIARYERVTGKKVEF